VSSNDWNLPQTENAYKWFLEKLTFLMEEDPASSETVAQIISGDERKARILKELLLADLGIVDVTVKNIAGNMPVVTTTHRILREDGTVDYFQLLMDQESAGTQHFFARIGGWLQALENGALLVVDEIEDSLHPLLTKRFIEMVQDRNVNTNGAQLLFTTHDAMLLDLSFLRRDQIWFAEKNDKSCATELYSLASFSPRKGENVRKGYLQGRFGAIPFIGGDTQWQN
jgi:AAA15 family ATPase/GTPase